MTQQNDKLTCLTLPSDREILITRVFNAPRELVWQAWTRPEHVVHWWSVQGLTLVSCEIDLHVGGRYRYVLQGSDGIPFAFSGEYREVLPPERLVYTDGFEGMPGHEALVTLTLSQQEGKTTLTSHSLYQSMEDRDGHIQSGMEEGLREALDRLAAHLTTLV